LMYPQMITEYESDNYVRSGTAFYIYSPPKKMFLHPNKDGLAKWIAVVGDTGDAEVVVKLRGSDQVLGAYHGEGDGAVVESYHDNKATQQRFKRVWNAKKDAFLLKFMHDEKLCVGVDDNNHIKVMQCGAVNVSEWRHEDGHIVDTRTGLCITGRVVAADRTFYELREKGSTLQKFDIEVTGCDQLRYRESDMLMGIMPNAECLKPWYIYEMDVDDPIAEN
jgi:hypothetical protein